MKRTMGAADLTRMLAAEGLERLHSLGK